MARSEVYIASFNATIRNLKSVSFSAKLAHLQFGNNTYMDSGSSTCCALSVIHVQQLLTYLSVKQTQQVHHLARLLVAAFQLCFKYNNRLAEYSQKWELHSRKYSLWSSR